MRRILLLALWGCTGGHDHDHGHGHGPGHSHEGAEVEARAHPNFTLTRWSATHELYLELTPPVVAQPIRYAAHVTRLADGLPVEAGMLTVDWVAGDTTVASFVAFELATPGIFAFSAPGPEAAGTYALRVGFGDATWDLGRFEIGAEPVAPRSPPAEVRLTKEAQWKVPVVVARPQPRALGRAVKMSAIVEPAPGETRALTAPAAGFLEWSPAVPLPVGARVEAGQVLATIYPAATSLNWSELRLAVREGEVERERARAEVRRLRPLVEKGLVAGRELDEASARLKRARARLDSARQQRDQSRGKRPDGIAVKAASAGVIVELGAKDGAAVASGQPLARVVSGRHWHLHADVLPAEVGGPAGVRSAWIDGPEPVPVDVSGLRDRVLVADPRSGLAPIEFEAPPGDWVLGARVPLRLMVGPIEPVVAIPRSAVVEINTRPYVFVADGGERFSRRRVELGPGDATHVGVTGGVSAQDRVVVRGGFDVYVASLAGTLESHTH